jgi:hypothetical protein
MREYKVLEVKKKSTFGFSRLDASGLESILNKQAAEGWLFDRTLNGETMFLDKDTVMLVFHREK